MPALIRIQTWLADRIGYAAAIVQTREEFMKRFTIILSAILLAGYATPALAAKYSYMIDHGTPGVIASQSKMARIVLKATGDCKNIPYEIITDGVKSITGSFDLSHEVSLPLDMTTVSLSCSDKGVTASIDD